MCNPRKGISMGESIGLALSTPSGIRVPKITDTPGALGTHCNGLHGEAPPERGIFFQDSSM